MSGPVVGLIGCGHIGRFHSRNIRGVFGRELVPGTYAAVCDRDPGRSAAFSSLTGADVADTAADVLARPGLTAVYVCTETAEHPAIVHAALDRGLAVFCEKPLARTLAEVEAMASHAATAGVPSQVGLILRTSPVFTVLADLMTDRSLGPLLTAHLRDDQFFPDHGHYGSTWRNDFRRAGGGTLIEHSIHDIDLFRWLFGEITGVRCRTRVTSGHDRVEDVAVVTFDHAGGHQTSLSSVWHRVDERPSTRRLEVFFEGGWFATDHDFIGPVHLQRRTGPEQVIGADEVFDRYCAIEELAGPVAEAARAGMLADLRFLQAVAAGQAAFPGFDVALAAHRVIDACYRSAADAGAFVRLPS